MIEAIKNLEKNNINAFFVENKTQALKKAISLIPKDATIGLGGSVTIEQIGLLDYLIKNNYKLSNQYDRSLSHEKSIEVRKKGTRADVFITGTNAITMDGKLVNVDGRGNRVSSVIYGPEKVIIVAGKNKIVENQEKAVERIKKIAAPLNARRLGKKTPCIFSGSCDNCISDDRICCSTVILEKQYTKRINMIIVNEELGF